MHYRKLAADHLFTGAELLGNQVVLITDPDGLVKDIVDVSDAGEGIERFEGILCPGFINCHCHLELSHLRGVIPDSVGMVDFLITVMGERQASLIDIHAAVEEAEASMIATGTVAVGDICNTTHTIEQKTQGNIYYHNFIETAGFVNASAPARFEAAVTLYNQFKVIGDSSIVPHAAYSVSETMFELINNFVPDSLLTLHNQESFAENEFFIRGSGKFLGLYKSIGVELADFKPTGKSSLLSCLPKISAAHPLILVHNVVTGEEEIQWTRNREVYWCLCPNANIYITDKLPDVPLFQRHGCKMVIGTDSLAANHQLNMLEELKTLQQNFNTINIEDLLRWSTINGAEALQIEQDYGSFEPGKMPGVVLIRGVEEGKLLPDAFSQRIL